jgi:hypothetical protein
MVLVHVCHKKAKVVVHSAAPKQRQMMTQPVLLDLNQFSQMANNLDLAFDKSNVDDQHKLFLLKNKWDIPSSFVFPLTIFVGPKGDLIGPGLKSISG